jgi:hypothetical protein
VAEPDCTLTQQSPCPRSSKLSTPLNKSNPRFLQAAREESKAKEKKIRSLSLPSTLHKTHNQNDRAGVLVTQGYEVHLFLFLSLISFHKNMLFFCSKFLWASSSSLFVMILRIVERKYVVEITKSD